jgi:hypothetical protein
VRNGRWRRLGLGIAWLLCSGVALAAGFALLVLALRARDGGLLGPPPGALELQVGLLLLRIVWLQALLPLWLATLVCWLLLVRLAPALDRRWRTLLPGIALTAALCFAPVGAFLFVDWQPTGPRDVVASALACAGGVSAALCLPRRLFRRLSPGAFTSSATPG